MAAQPASSRWHAEPLSAPTLLLKPPLSAAQRHRARQREPTPCGFRQQPLHAEARGLDLPAMPGADARLRELRLRTVRPSPREQREAERAQTVVATRSGYSGSDARPSINVAVAARAAATADCKTALNSLSAGPPSGHS